jgi:DNA-binding NarL/FixJ family response regulator
MTETNPRTTEPSARKTRAIIVEDEWIVARDLQHILEEIGLEIIRLVRRPADLHALLDEQDPDLVVLDIDLGAEIDGIELAEQIHKTHPNCALLFVSAHAEPETLARIRKVDAHGFVVKPFARPQLEAAVQVALARVDRTADNAQAALREIARVLADAGALPSERRKSRDWRTVPGLDDLSPREVQVLEALLAHRRPPQIAEDLGISPHTVRNHLKSIYAKCGVRSQAELLQLIVDG